MIGAAILGPLGPAQLACVRSWRSRGFRTIFAQSAGGRRIPRLDRYVDVYIQASDLALGSAKGRAQLLRLLKDAGATGVAALSYSLTDTLHKMVGEATAPCPLQVWATPAATLGFLNSKLSQLQLAEACGLAVAPHWSYPSGETVPCRFDMGPMVVRPDGGGATEPEFKVQYVANSHDFESFIKSFTVIRRPLVLQPFLPGQNIVVHGARSTLTGKSLHVGFEVDRMLDGVTLTMRHSKLPDMVMQRCAEFADRAGLAGVYHFEFRRDSRDGIYYFLEVNGRLGGTTGKVFRLGYDEPFLLVQSFIDNKLEEPCIRGDWTASNRQAIARAAIKAWRGDLTVFDYPEMSTLARLRDLAMGFFKWHDELYYWQRRGSAFSYMLQQVVSAMGRQ